jgi:cation diffusion facilitator family transporter
VAEPVDELQETLRGVRKVSGRTLLANILLALAKMAAGILGRSQALVADAVHTLSDSCTDVTIYVGVRFWTRPPDEDHPHGHARIETVIGAVIGVVVAVTGIGLGFHSINSLGRPPALPPGWLALVAAVVSVILKEWIYRWTRKKGRQLRSSALAANAWHQRTDALSSLPVVAAVGISILHPAWALLDVVVGFVVSVFIVVAAWKILRPALSQLVDTAPPHEVRDRLSGIALSVPGVRGVHSLRSRYQGSGIEVDMHVIVDGAMPVTQGYMISTQVEEKIRRQAPGVVGVVVRTEPVAPCGDPDSCTLIGSGSKAEHDPEGSDR